MLGRGFDCVIVYFGGVYSQGTLGVIFISTCGDATGNVGLSGDQFAFSNCFALAASGYYFKDFCFYGANAAFGYRWVFYGMSAKRMLVGVDLNFTSDFDQGVVSMRDITSVRKVAVVFLF